MKSLAVILALVLICCVQFILTTPAEDHHKVQFVNYRSDKDLEDIQRQIIAQYEHLGGTSEIHEEQRATFVDPHNIKLNF